MTAAVYYTAPAVAEIVERRSQQHVQQLSQILTDERARMEDVYQQNVRTLASALESEREWSRAALERAALEARRDGYRQGYRVGYEQGTDDTRRASEHLQTWRLPDLPTLEQACRRAEERPELIHLAEAIAADPRVTDDMLNEIITAAVERRAALRNGKVS